VGRPCQIDRVPTTLRIYLEQGQKKVFASALDWPGWSRWAKDDEAAIDELLAYAERYADVAVRAGARLPAAHDVVVVERVRGDATTDFGAPSVPAAVDAEPLSATDITRQVALLRASWDVLGSVAASAPAELRKGPRGGGRDRDAVVAHVQEAERAYARKLGVRHPPYKSDADVRTMREELAAALLSGAAEGPWSPAYAIRRIAWHVLDHAWEIEDKSV
jgi:hypothetical protein